MFNLSICEQWLRYGHKGLGHKNCFFLNISKRKGDWSISKGDFENDGLQSFSFNFEEKISKKVLSSFMSIEFRRDIQCDLKNF